MREPFLFYKKMQKWEKCGFGCETKIKHLINLSSSCIYPKNMGIPLKENLVLTGPLEPTNEGYAIAKIFVQKLCTYINREDFGKIQNNNTLQSFWKI